MATAVRTVRSHARRRRIRNRLRRLHWGWWIAAAILAVKTVETWTAQIITALAVTAAVSIAVYGRQARLGRWIPRPRGAQHASLGDYLALDPTGFEHAIAQLARRDPQVRTAVRQGGANDRAADVIVRLRDGRRILIQCKRYRPGNNVSSEHIQMVNGTYRDIHRCDHAVIVTTSGYTRDAIRTNTMLARPLLLVDGQALMAWTAGGPPPWA